MTNTYVGNLAADPELKYTANGMPVANFTLMYTYQKKNHQTGSWDENGKLNIRVSAFNELAENVANSLKKGTRAIVTGNLKQSEYVDKNNVERMSLELVAEDAAVSLKFATVQFAKTPQPQKQVPSQSNQGRGTPPQAAEPRDQAGGASNANQWTQNDTPPF